MSVVSPPPPNQVAAVREKHFFSRLGQSLGILYKAREILNCTSKTVKTQGFCFYLLLGVMRIFYCWQCEVVSKNIF